MFVACYFILFAIWNSLLFNFSLIVVCVVWLFTLFPLVTVIVFVLFVGLWVL